MKKHLFIPIAIGTTLALGLSLNAQVCFTPSSASPFAVGTQPYTVTSADFNADGKADLAVANNSSNTVSVLMATGAGSFAPAVNFAVGQSPYSVISADFNADGKADLAAENNSSNTVSVLLNCTVTGIATFANEQQINIYPNPTTGMLNIELEILNGATATIEITDVLG